MWFGELTSEFATAKEAPSNTRTSERAASTPVRNAVGEPAMSDETQLETTHGKIGAEIRAKTGAKT